jgi:nucleotide-binding universal stress UspA family protein
MNVMIAVDGSPHSDAAVEFVRKMTLPQGSRVTVVSSVALPTFSYVGSYVPADLQVETWLGEITKAHEDVVSRDVTALHAAGVHVESRVLQGDPRDTLVEEARRLGANLLVVGSHGRTGFDKLVMGSVSSHVMAHAPCSVLLVKLKAAK